AILYHFQPLPPTFLHLEAKTGGIDPKSGIHTCFRLQTDQATMPPETRFSASVGPILNISFRRDRVCSPKCGGGERWDEVVRPWPTTVLMLLRPPPERINRCTCGSLNAS